MRLTCPRCGAQYEIPAAAIPAAGREVECSACGNVWFQSGQPRPAAAYDPKARPVLNQPLNESILEILRDETARELQARKAEAGKPVPETDQDGADQNIANTTPEAPPAPEAAPVPAAPHERPPAEPITQTQAAEVAPPETRMGSDIDWPATTLTAAPPEPAPAEPVAPGPAPDQPQPAPEPAKAAADRPAPFEAPAAAPPAPAPAPAQEHRHKPVVAALPDAAELAATLTRPGPAPEPITASAVQPPADATDASETAPAAPLPVVTTQNRGSGYASGFGLAAMLALGVIAVYALAARVAADEDGGLLAEWRQGIDRGRLWLHDRIIGE